MTVVDWGILGLFLLSTLVGIWRGFIKEALSLTAWGLAFFVAWQFTDDVLQQATPIKNFLDTTVPQTAAQSSIIFGSLFVLTLFVMGLFNFVLGKLIAKSPLAGINRFLGMLFGVMRGVVILALLLAVLDSTPVSSWLPWNDSVFIPYVKELTAGLFAFIGEGVQTLSQNVQSASMA